MKSKKNYKIVLIWIITGIALWMIDAVIGSRVFSNKPFIDSLILGLSGNEIYFQVFFLGSLLLSGLITAKVYQRKKELEKDIFRSEKDWKNTFDSINDAITIHDRDFNIIHANRAAEKILGLPAFKILNQKCYALYHGTDCHTEKCPSCDTLKTGVPATTEMFDPDLNKYIEIKAFPRFDKDKNITSIVHVVRDITARKRTEEEIIKHRHHLEELVKDKTSELKSTIDLLRDEINRRRHTEEALRSSERRYRELFNYMSSGVAVFEAIENGKDFIFKDFNKSGERIDKIKKENIIGEKISKVFPGIKECGLFDVLQNVWKNGESEYHPVSEYKDQRITGWRENYVYKLPSGEIVTIFNDVTERRHLEERGAELLSELKTIFDNIPLMIVYFDNELKVKSANKFFYEIGGLSEEDIIGKRCYEVVGEYADDSSRKGPEKICSFCKKDECLKYKMPSVMERPFADKIFKITIIPELDESGNITHFLEIGEDITERRHAEAEVIRAGHLAALGELAAGVAHEINNPINGIINYSQILINMSRKESREYDISTRIIKEGDRIVKIVRSLLTFASDKKEEKTLSFLQEMLSNALFLVQTQLQKDGIKLKINLPAEVPPVICNSQQIEQVFLNVISNARYALNQKFPGEHKDKALEICLEQNIFIEDKSYIKISFHDKGTGIPSEIRDKIMNPFYTTKLGREGTGLGLSISHSIVSKHGGRITIDSIEGEFTRVSIALPLEVPDDIEGTSVGASI